MKKAMTNKNCQAEKLYVVKKSSGSSCMLLQILGTLATLHHFHHQINRDVVGIFGAMFSIPEYIVPIIRRRRNLIQTIATILVLLHKDTG